MNNDDVKIIINKLISQYKSELPLSVLESLVTTLKIKGDVYPIRYATHIEPFVKYRDNVKYKIIYHNENFIKIQSIIIENIEDGNEDEYNSFIADSPYFNFNWVDDYNNQEEYNFFYRPETSKVLQMVPLEQKTKLVLTLI